MIDWNDNAKAAVKAYDDWAGNESSMYVSYIDEFMQGIKQTKTVADAVADHDGKWPNEAHRFIYYCLERNQLVSHAAEYKDTKEAYLVCTRAEFEAYVKEQEGEKWTHIGENGIKCRLVSDEPDYDGLVPTIKECGGYYIQFLSELKPIKPTIRPSAAWALVSEKGWPVHEVSEHYDVVKD